MEFRFSRRKLIQGAGAAGLAQSVEVASVAPSVRKWPIEEGPDTPKISLSLSDGGRLLPANLQPPTQAPDGRGAVGGPSVPGGAGAAREAGRGGGFGGTLAPRPEAALATQATATPPGGGGFGSNPAAYQRIRQLGVTHLSGVGVGMFPWQEENIRGAIQTAQGPRHGGL